MPFRIPLFFRVLPVYLLVAGLVLLPVWQKRIANARALEASRHASLVIRQKPAVRPAVTVSGVPTHIVIGSVGVDVPIVAGRYDAQKTVWSVSGDAANYAVNTASLNNQRDGTLIYGHWTPAIFGPIKQLQPGSIAYVYTDNGHLFAYTFTSSTSYAPSDDAIFDRLKGKPGLALMTCEGTWAQERRVLFFTLTEVR